MFAFNIKLVPLIRQFYEITGDKVKVRIVVTHSLNLPAFSAEEAESLLLVTRTALYVMKCMMRGPAAHMLPWTWGQAICEFCRGQNRPSLIRVSH